MGAGLTLTTPVNTGVGPATAVPEASTWAMMLVGFAGLGFAGYRRCASLSHTLGAAALPSSRNA